MHYLHHLCLLSTFFPSSIAKSFTVIGQFIAVGLCTYIYIRLGYTFSSLPVEFWFLWIRFAYTRFFRISFEMKISMYLKTFTFHALSLPHNKYNFISDMVIDYSSINILKYGINFRSPCISNQVGCDTTSTFSNLNKRIYWKDIFTQKCCHFIVFLIYLFFYKNSRPVLERNWRKKWSPACPQSNGPDTGPRASTDTAGQISTGADTLPNTTTKIKPPFNAEAKK